MKRQTTQESPIELPTGFNAWLLDCAPSPGCNVCTANWQQLNAAKQRGDITQAARHADEIRGHRSSGGRH
jgi:hypothetical protein